MERYLQVLLIGLLLICSNCFGASIDTTSTVKCTKSKGTTCIIKSLSLADGSNLPDLSRRTVLKILEGPLSNLTEEMAKKLPVRILWLEGLDLQAVFVAPNFEELHLRDNKLVAIESSASTTTYALKVLDVRKNSLHNTTQLAPFHSLEELYLDENKFTELKMELFVSLTQLRVLSATRNGIVKIAPPTSTPLLLSELTSLSLAHNRLTSLEMNQWQLPSLQTLSLNRNNLTEVEGLEALDKFYDLQKVELAGNPWNCGWLQHALENTKIRKSANDPTDGILLDASPEGECTIEKVHGICCSFTIATNADEVSKPVDMFLPEINRVREAIVQLDRRHEASRAVEEEMLKKLNNSLQSGVDEFSNYLIAQKDELGQGIEQAARIVQKVTRLEEAAKAMETDVARIKVVQQERKRLLHFMVDMKNNLLRQAIETDRLWVEAKKEKVDYDRKKSVESSTP